MSMAFWITVAILSLFCLMQLFWRDARRTKPRAQAPRAIGSLTCRAVESEAALAKVDAECPAQPAPRKPDYRYRSAITGKFVKASYAKRYPHRTVRAKVKS